MTKDIISEVYNMDCIAGMREYPDKYFDLAIVDPPYGIGLSKNPFRQKQEKKNWDLSIPEMEYFIELFRVSKEQIIWGGNYFDLPPTRCFIVWDKGEGMQDRSFSECEYAWTSFDESARIKRFNPVQPFRIHPTQKPVSLYEWLLTHYAKQGDKILDTHLGSGSSRIAAYNLGFDFVGCEIDEDYFDAQEKRFAAHAAQTSLFDGEG